MIPDNDRPDVLRDVRPIVRYDRADDSTANQKGTAMHGFQSLAVFLLLGQNPSHGGLNLEQIVARHQASIEAIHTIDVNLVLNVYSSGKSKSVSMQSREIRWSKMGSRQRLRMKLDMDGNAADKQKVLHYDSFVDAARLQTLEGWSPEAPPVITPLDNQDVQGTIEPFPGNFPAPQVDPASLLNMKFDMAVGDPPRSLKDLIGSRKESVKIADATIDGDPVYRLTIPYHDRNGETGRAAYEIDIDPKNGFLARRVVTRATDLSIDKSPPMSFRNETIVEKYETFPEGILIPSRLKSLSFRGNSSEPDTSAEVIATTKVVNEPLPDDAFDFKFPEHCIVRTLPPVAGRAMAELWGKDNRPVAQIKKQTDLIDAAAKLGFKMEGAARTANPRGRLAMGAALAVITLGLIIVMIMRRGATTRNHSFGGNEQGSEAQERRK